MADGDKPDAPDTLRTMVVDSGVATTQRAGVAPPMPADWRYQERAEIARGGMGRVVEATDNVLGRTVAVKEALSLDADTVARFHLRNGARIERLNWLADDSEQGMRRSAGLMVNYMYDLEQVERNHEAYVKVGQVAASHELRALLRASPLSRPAVKA